MKTILTLILIGSLILQVNSQEIKESEPQIRLFEKVETWWDGKDYRFLCIEISKQDLLVPYLNLRYEKEGSKPGDSLFYFKHISYMISYENSFTFPYWASEAKWFFSPLESYLILGTSFGGRNISQHEIMIKVLDNHTVQAFFFYDSFSDLPNDMLHKNVYNFFGFKHVPEEISFRFSYAYWTYNDRFNIPIFTFSIPIHNFKVNKNQIEPLDTEIYDPTAPLATRKWFIEWFKNNPDVMPPKYANFQRLIKE